MDRFVLMARWFVKKYLYSAVFSLFFFFFLSRFLIVFLPKCFEGEKRNFQLIYQYKYRSSSGKFQKVSTVATGSDVTFLPFTAAPLREFTAI